MVLKISVEKSLRFRTDALTKRGFNRRGGTGVGLTERVNSVEILIARSLIEREHNVVLEYK